MPVKRSAAAAIAAAATFALTGSSLTAAPSAKPVETVAVVDDYYAPADLKIKPGTKVKWQWDQFNTNTHDVKLTDVHPKGVKTKDFRSSSGSIGVKFARTFETPGKYGFVCTLHRTVMRMTIAVKKP